jgi:hypothetical protein
LDRRCSQEQRSGDAATIGNSSRCNDRQFDGIDDRGKKAEQADHSGFGLSGVERAAVTTCFHALSDNNVRTGAFSGFCFANGRNCRQPLNSLAFHARYELLRK